MTTIEKAEFLKSVDKSKLSTDTSEIFNELQSATDNFTDIDLLESMGEVVDETINRIKSEIGSEGGSEKVDAIDNDQPVEAEEKPKRQLRMVTPPKIEVKRKSTTYTQECVALNDEFMSALKEIIEQDCNSGSYVYTCSMASTEQGLTQLARQVFEIITTEKNMSIQSALSIIESDNSND